MKYAVEVIADSSEVFCGNGLTFDTYEQAEAYAKDLYSRWTALRSWRVMQIFQMGWQLVRIPIQKAA